MAEPFGQFCGALGHLLRVAPVHQRGLADNFLRGITEEPFGGGVENLDDTVFVRGDDGIIGGMEDGVLQRQCFAQSRLGAAAAFPFLPGHETGEREQNKGQHAANDELELGTPIIRLFRGVPHIQHQQHRRGNRQPAEKMQIFPPRCLLRCMAHVRSKPVENLTHKSPA